MIAERSPVIEPTRSTAKQRASNPRPPTRYAVRKGDTLYSIAWRYQLDPHGLARANGIAPPYTIFPGQQLRLINQLPSGQRAAIPSGTPSTSSSTRAPVKKPAVTQSATKSRTSKQPARSTAKQPDQKTVVARWVWPTPLKPSKEFSAGNKGIDFHYAAHVADRAVQAAGSGQVVYAGNGIGGFERLVIIKHTQSLLTAYSLDGVLKVTEGARVKAGAPVADIKATGRNRQRLHFELRRDGRPINPRSVLP